MLVSALALSFAWLNLPSLARAFSFYPFYIIVSVVYYKHNRTILEEVYRFYSERT